MSLEKVTVEYTSKVDELEAGLNRVKKANEEVDASAKKTGRDIEEGFLKGSNGAKRFEAELKRTAKTQAEVELKVQKLKELLRDDTQLGSAAFKKVQSEIKKTEAELDKITKTSKGYGSALTQITALAAGAFTLSRVKAFAMELIKTQREAEILANQFAFVNGNAEAGRASFESLRKTSQKLGLDFQVLSEEYVSFANAAGVMNLSNDQSLQIFQDMSIGLRGAGASAQQQQQAFLALTQIMSKGRLMGQELTLQLGNALPGAVGLAAKAMNVTTGELNKMMERGEVMATDFVPRFAAAVRDNFAAAVAGKENSLDASINRAGNSWQAFKRALEVPLVQPAVDGLNLRLERTNILLNASIPGWEKTLRVLGDHLGLAFLNQNVLADYNAEQEKQAALQKTISANIEAEANRIMGLTDAKKQDALAQMQIDKQNFEGQMQSRKLIGDEITNYNTLIATLDAVSAKEANATAAKLQADNIAIEKQKEQIELQKKKEEALRNYIKAINEEFKALEEMHKLDEENTTDSIKNIEAREKRAKEAKEKSVNDIAGTIQNFDDWQKQQMDKMLDESDKAYQTDVDNYKSAQAQKAQATSAFLQAASQLTNDFFALQFALSRQQTQAEIENNKNLLDQREISEEEYNSRVIKLKRDQFNREKSLQSAQAIMNGALAITNILANWAKNPLVAAGLITLTAAATGIQLATINAQTPGFKDGVIDLQGEGTSTSDSITARLSRGESVMTAAETRQHKADLMAMRDGNWDKHVKQNYIMPELTKLARKEQSSFAQNVANSLGKQSFDDTGIIHALNKRGKLAEETIEKLGMVIARKTTNKAMRRRTNA